MGRLNHFYFNVYNKETGELLNNHGPICFIADDSEEAFLYCNNWAENFYRLTPKEMREIHCEQVEAEKK